LKKFKSLREHIWLYFMIFAFLILLLLWLFLFVFVKSYYKTMKIRDVKDAAVTISVQNLLTNVISGRFFRVWRLQIICVLK